MKNARFFFGYAVDAYRVPLAWAPPGRVFMRVDLGQARILDLAEGAVVDGWGDWPRGLDATGVHRRARCRGGGRVGPCTTACPRRSVVHALGLRRRRAGHRRVAAPPDPCRDGRVLWRGALERRGVRGAAPGELRGADPAGPRTATALTIDRRRRGGRSEMRGSLLRGPADAFVPAARSGASRRCGAASTTATP